MPQTLAPPAPTVAATLNPPRKRWTRTDVEFLERSGLLDDGRYELVNGEIIFKMAQNRPHIISTTLFNDWLTPLFRGQVQNQGTIDVSPEDNPSSRPEPDIAVVKGDVRFYNPQLPRPDDLELVVEVSDTTLEYDLGTKASLYARAGILEYWVVDVNHRQIIVHRAPHQGVYADIAAYGETEEVAPLARPDQAVRVDTLLP